MDRLGNRLRAGVVALLTLPAAPLATTPAALAATPATDLDGKIVVGYQGWFGCPGDAGDAGLMHWQRQDGGLAVEMLPDLSELPASDTCRFQPKPGGPAVTVYSAANPDVINMHFRWMHQYGIATAAVQRFVSILKVPVQLAFYNRELLEIQHAAERQQRSFFVEYDLSGSNPDDAATIVGDVRSLVAAGLTRSTAFQRLRGRPLIGLWGLGFAGRPWTPAAAAALIADVHGVTGGLSVMVGVPAYWRTGTRDASSDPAWLAVWPKADVLTPWTVGRFGDATGADRFRRDVMTLDAAWARAASLVYLPTAFPGFSWSNAHAGAAVRNQIPRRCGAFLRDQLDGIRALHLDTTFIAMFDEVDEGTAIYKTLAHRPEQDVLALDADGCNEPPDYYLALVREKAAELRSK